MDEKLKQKLELLGEVALPDSLTPEALFRRMDSGELTLPQEEPARPPADTAGKVLSWSKVLRRGLPVAACLALVVFLAQGGLWRMGSSGGANLSGDAAALQKSSATADQAAPVEEYAFGTTEGEIEAPSAAPDSSPRAIIAMDDGAQIEEDIAEDADADTSAARVENGEQMSAEAADIAEESVADAEAPDNANPDSGPRYYDSEDHDNAVNPDMDIGPSDYEREQNDRKAAMEAASAEEMCGWLYLYDGSLAGLTPVLERYGPVDAMGPDPSYPLHIWCSYQNDAGEVVARRVIYCSVDQKNADGGCDLSLLTFGEWDGGETPLIRWKDLG